LARQAGASILLRIDDLDQDRVSKEYVEDIFETLEFLGIPWEEGPRNFADFQRNWSQLHRLGIYRECLETLREQGKIFACDCSRTAISRLRADGVYPGTCRERGISPDTSGCAWRVRTEGAGLSAAMTDFVVKKKDGLPAYQLTSVADDLYYGIDLVVRGADLRASTGAQRWLAGMLGREDFRRIGFVHHPLLTDAAKLKLSKSAGSASVQSLRRSGLMPEALYTMILARLGKDFPARTWEEFGSGMAREWGLRV
jgi:glutamyl-tRNA synthetase